MKSTKIPTTVDEYISFYPGQIGEKLQKIRAIIRRCAPEASETISYRMPAYKQNGVLVYFAAFRNHIGFYPTSSGIYAFNDELADYHTSKGAIQFPYENVI